MGAQKVHGGVEGGGGVVLPDGLHGLHKVLGGAVQEIGQQGVAEGVVHHPMELLPQQVLPAAGVGNLVAGVLPDLPQDHGVRVRLLHGGAELFDELIGQLVGHVQPPAGGPGPQPALHNGVLPGDDIVHVVRAVLPDVGQGADAPPGVVGPRPLPELEPVVVRTLLTLGGPQGGVKAVGVEVDALRARVVEHAVQNYPDAPLFRLGAEIFKILLGAQHGVDPGVVRRVVPVVGGGLEDGAEVDGRDPQGLQVVQMGGHPRQGPAEEVPVFDLPALGPPGGALVPVLVYPAVADEPGGIGVGQAAVAVREDLIGDALAEPGGSAALLVDRQLPGHRLALAVIAGLVQEAAGAVVPPEAEPVPGQLRRLEGNQGDGETGPVLPEAGKGHFGLHLVSGEFPVDDDGTVGEALDGQGAAGKGPGHPAGKRAIGGFALGVAGVEDGRCVHEKNSLFVKIRGSRK